jgi:hypothetical protein
MRTAFLVIFFALLAICSRADPIDNVVTNLEDGWRDNETDLVIMPKTASSEDVLQKVFRTYVFYFGEITNFTVLKSRQVAIPCCHFRGAPVYSYTAVLVQASQGGKVVVLLRSVDAYTSRAWLNAVFYTEPAPAFTVKLTYPQIGVVTN